MYERIKQLADEAVALQNKARMEEVLREISGMCAHARRPLDLGTYEYGFPPDKMAAEQFEAAEVAQHQAARAGRMTAEWFNAPAEAGGAGYGDGLKQSMKATVQDVETTVAIVTGNATPLTRKQRAPKEAK